MEKDGYQKSAKNYDRLFEKMNKGLRLIGMRMFRPSRGMNILDVGCGTGTHLELYQRYACQLYGLDSSPSMLDIARQRLKDTAKLDLANAAKMPYEAQMFDLIIAMLALHEMPPEVRLAVVEEIKRVLKKDGHILIIDYHTGTYQPMEGWTAKMIILLAELAAGREHYRNYRKFMRAGGIASQVRQMSLPVEKEQVVAGGTFGIYLMGGSH